jgi:hypothetical protein
VEVQVHVPAGAAPGATLLVSHEGVDYRAVVPEGVAAGQQLIVELELPAALPPVVVAATRCVPPGPRSLIV